MAANQRFRIILDAGDQRGHSFSSSDVSCDHRGVSKQPSPLWSREGRSPESLAKFMIGFDREHLSEIKPGTDAGFGSKLRPRCVGREAVERAYVLANIATEYPFANRSSKLARYRPLVFDCHVGNASSRVQSIWARKSIGWASVDAA